MELQLVFRCTNGNKRILVVNDPREDAELDVLVEGFDEDNLAYGRSTHEAPDIDGTIFIENAEGLKVGDMVRVRILQGFTYEMVAEKV